MENGKVAPDKLRILFITQEDPFYVGTFFGEFLKEYSQKVEILGAVICTTMGKKSPLKLAKQMYGFYGPVNFAKMSFRFALSKLAGGAGRLFAEHGVKVYRTNDVNGKEFLDYWRPKGLDVIVSIAAPMIFRKELLELPKWGCLNIHHAKLPNYRGMMPNFWQMYHGEKVAGVSVHRMNEKIDQGEIIFQGEVPIEPGETLDHLIVRTKKMGARFVFDALELIRTGRVSYLPKSAEQGSYFTFPTAADVREFRRRGYRII